MERSQYTKQHSRSMSCNRQTARGHINRIENKKACIKFIKFQWKCTERLLCLKYAIHQPIFENNKLNFYIRNFWADIVYTVHCALVCGAMRRRGQFGFELFSMFH